MLEDIKEVSEYLYCEYEVEDGNIIKVNFKNFKDKFQLICKVKEKWTTVIKLKNGEYEKKYCFYNREKLKSFICCQFALECFQRA